MRVSVKFIGSLRSVNAPREKVIELPVNSKVIDLINNISIDYPEVMKKLGNPAMNLIMIDGIEVENLEGLETEIIDGSKLVIIPVTHGG